MIDLSLVAMEASCLELVTDVALQRAKKDGTTMAATVLNEN